MQSQTIVINRDLTYSPAYEQMKAWCQHYGIDPNDVPIESKIVLHFDRNAIEYERFARDDDGRPEVVPGTNDVRRIECLIHVDEPLQPWPMP